MAEATLSAKNQIVIPKEAREALGIKPGDKLLVVVKDGGVIILPRPKSFREALTEMSRGIYPDGYLDKERQSWD